MDSDNAGVPEELEVRANKREETNENDTNGSAQPCDSSCIGSNPYLEKGPLVYEVNHRQLTPVEESRVPQPVDTKQGNVLKYPVKTIQLKLGNISRFPAKNIPQKPAVNSKISAKPTSSKQINIPNFSAKPVSFKPADTSKLSVKPASLTLADTPKFSAKPFQVAGSSKLSPKSIPFKFSNILKLAKPAPPKQSNRVSLPEKNILNQDPSQANTLNSSAKLNSPKLVLYNSKLSSKITPPILGNLFTSTERHFHKPNLIPESSEETMASKKSEPSKRLVNPPRQGDTSMVSEDDKLTSLPTSSKATMTSKQGDTSQPSSKTLPPKQGDLLKVFTKPSIPKQGSISTSSEDTFLPKQGDIPKVLGKPSMPKQENFSKASEKAISPKPGDILKAYTKPIVPKKQGSTPKSEEAFLPKLGASAKHFSPKQDSTLKSSEESTLPKQEDIPRSSKESIMPKQEDTLTLSKEIVSSVESNLLRADLENFRDSHMARVREVLSQEDFQLALREAGDRLVAVDFSAQWCGPCQLMKPLFHSLSAKHSDVVFLEVDVDQCEELAQEQAIFAIPAFRFYKNEKMVAEFGGASKEKLEATIEKLK